MRPAHIHFQVSGRQDKIVTQMYFENLSAPPTLLRNGSALYSTMSKITNFEMVVLERSEWSAWLEQTGNEADLLRAQRPRGISLAVRTDSPVEGTGFEPWVPRLR